MLTKGFKDLSHYTRVNSNINDGEFLASSSLGKEPRNSCLHVHTDTPGKSKNTGLNTGHHLHIGGIFLQYIIKATVLRVPKATEVLQILPTSLNSLRNVNVKLYLKSDKNLLVRQHRHLYKHLYLQADLCQRFTALPRATKPKGNRNLWQKLERLLSAGSYCQGPLPCWPGQFATDRMTKQKTLLHHVLAPHKSPSINDNYNSHRR